MIGFVRGALIALSLLVLPLTACQTPPLASGGASASACVEVANPRGEWEMCKAFFTPRGQGYRVPAANPNLPGHNDWTLAGCYRQRQSQEECRQYMEKVLKGERFSLILIDLDGNAVQIA